MAELGHALSDARVMAHAAWMRGYGLCVVGAPWEARRSLEEALPFFESTDDKWWVAEITGHIGRTYLHEGEVDRARAYLQKTLELREAVADQAEVAWASCYMGDVAFVAGEWAEARRYYEQTASLAQRIVPRYHCHALLHLGELSLLEGETEQATRVIEQGLTVGEQCSEVAAIRKAQGLLAEQDLAANDPERAFSRLQPLLAGLGTELPHAFPPPVLAEVYVAMGDEVRADKLVTEHIDRFRRQRRHRSLTHWLRVQGGVRAQQGRWEDAQQAYAEAATLAHAIHYPQAEGAALYDSGVLHGHRGQVRQTRERLEEALAIFRLLPAKPHVKRIEDALTR
jgi:tetratricopeptide (TPR) repeat protein